MTGTMERTDESMRTLEAVDELIGVLEGSENELGALLARARELRTECATGQPMRELVPQEPRPLVIQRITDLLDRLSEAGSSLRRAQARQLRAEGLSQQEIATLYGVSRQRIAALLDG